jgi:hypothetical protein
VHGDLKHESNETFMVNLLSPVNATLGQDHATGTILNDDPEPTIDILDVSTFEGESGTTNAMFTVKLSRPSSSVVTVMASTSSDTATPGSDYTTTSSTVTFLPGELTHSFIVPVFGDRIFENNETFFVTLSNAMGGTLGDSGATGTILNDDPTPTITIKNATPVVEGDNGTRSAVFTVELSNPSSKVVSVTLATADHTANAGSDYVGGTTLTFNPGGPTSQTFSVLIKGDVLNENDEDFFVNLTNPINGDIDLAHGTGIGTITDDDAARVRVEDVSIVEGNSGNKTLNFVVTLSTASAIPITVDFATMDGSAV